MLPKEANYTHKIPKLSKYYSYEFDIEGGLDKICVFILSQDTINKYTWDEIRDEYKIIKRYDLTEKNIKDMNWKINYP